MPPLMDDLPPSIFAAVSRAHRSGDAHAQASSSSSPPPPPGNLGLHGPRYIIGSNGGGGTARAGGNDLLLW